MKEGEELFEIKIIVDRKSLEKLTSEYNSTSNIIFDALVEKGVDVKEVMVHKATALRHSGLYISVHGNGNGSHAKDWKRY